MKNRTYFLAGPRVTPPPIIKVQLLPPLSDDTAYVLKRGNGVSWSVVDELQPRVVLDTKYTENMVFFDGEKRKGTYLAVHLLRESRVAGMLCADTLDSTTGHELRDSDAKLFGAVSVVVSECLDKAAWLFMEAKRQMLTQQLQALANDPSTLPEQICKVAVDAIDVVAPGCLVSIGTLDTPVSLRLVYRSKSDNTKEANKVVTIKDKGKDIPAIFQCFTEKAKVLGKNPSGEVDCVTIPVVDSDQRVSAVVYVANDHVKNRLAEEESVHFITSCASLLSSVLLTPSRGAVRRLRILAEAGTGDSAAVFDLALELCQRHTGVSEALIGMAAGPGALRVVAATKGAAWHLPGSLVDSTERPSCFDAMHTGVLSAFANDLSAPLLRRDGRGGAAAALGVICVKASRLDGDERAVLEGIAEGVTAALSLSEFRRKMALCGQPALQSLLTRASTVRGAYLSFLDVKGREVCAATLGDAIEGVERGRLIERTSGLQIAQVVSAHGGPPVGLIGTLADWVRSPVAGQYDESAWDVLKDCAETMGHVADVVAAEGIQADLHAAAPNREGGASGSEALLATHFKAARFDLVTEVTVKGVELASINQLKKEPSPRPIMVAIVQAIMYILGHQQRDVSDWTKCRKLITHHLFKEMKMIEVRSQLKVHKLKLARACIAGLSATEVALGAGPGPLLLWKWVLMILQVQGLE